MSNSFSFTVFHSNWQYFTHSNSQQLTVIHCDEPNTGFEPRLISAYFVFRWGWVWLALTIDHNKYAVPYQYSAKMITVKGSGNQVIMLFRGKIIAKYDRDYRHNQTHYRLEHYIGLIEKRPRSVYNAAPIKKTVPTELYQFLMKLSSPKEIVKVLRLYLDTGNAVLEHLPYADSYNTLYAGVIGSPVREMPIESSIGIVPPDLKRYDSLLKGGDVV